MNQYNEVDKINTVSALLLLIIQWWQSAVKLLLDERYEIQRKCV